MFRPKNKAERLQLREFYLTGYTTQENKEADCVIATSDENGRYLLRIFDGSAYKPCTNYSYRTPEQRQREIDSHIKSRLERMKAKEAHKQAKNAAGAYVIDKSKPYFEVGREYFMNYYGDDPYEHTATIRVIKRTACFVTLAHVYWNHEEEPQRVKVSVDQNGEYLSYGSFYYFRASSCVEQSQTEEAPEAQQETAPENTHADEGCAFIEQTAAQYPIKPGDPVVTIHWSECPAFYGWEDNELKLSVAAADIVLLHFDKRPTDGWCYYKTKFTVDYVQDGEPGSFTDRYDLGDNLGGLIADIRRYKPALSDFLEGYTSAGRVVSVSVAPWLEKAVEDRQKAAQRDAQNIIDMVEMLTDEQLAAAVLRAPKDNLDIGRFFLQALARRDQKKALAVFKAWRSGSGIEAIDDIF